jgi:hypothetical protein
MNRRFMLLILFLYAIASATAVFGAKAARSSRNNQANMVPIESRQQPLSETGPETSSVTSCKPSPSHVPLGYLMSPGYELGRTTCDLQHNSRMARQIEQGANGRVHFVWTYAPLPYAAASRSVWYTSYNPATGVFAPEAFSVSDQVSKMPGRFCAIDVFANRAFVVDHYGSSPTITSALDIAPGGGTFTAEDPPSTTINFENKLCGSIFSPYVWPVVATDVNPDGSKLVIHIAAVEYNTSAALKAITYFRGVSSGVTMDPGMYGLCGHFIDCCSAIGYDIAASPYNNDVVIAYPIARQANFENNDLAYRLSHDMGVTWEQTVNVTNFATGAEERCAGDLSVLFTSDGNFHILYVATDYDSVAGTVSDQQCRLWHWSSGNPTQRTLVLDANDQDPKCNTAAFEYNVCKVNLTQCHRTSGTPADMLYAVYSRQLGTTDRDCSHLKYFNQEVFMSPSSTWGETWGAPVNLTNTNRNDCVAPDCADDGSTSSARYVKDSLRIEYMEDRDAGSKAGNESSTTWTENPIRFISSLCIDMAPYRILTCTPRAIKLRADLGATATLGLVLINGGNQSINWSSGVMGNADIRLPEWGTVPAGYTSTTTITVTAGPFNDPGHHEGTITFSYDNPSKILIVNVDLLVTNANVLPQNIPIRTSNNRLIVNQVGQAAGNRPGSSFTYFADSSEDFITDASLIMGNSANNLSWRIFEIGKDDPSQITNEQYQGDPTEENSFGWFYGMSYMRCDTTSFSSYRIASGKGTNRDSTVGFDVQWYAAKFVDSGDFYVGHFEVYKGTKGTGVSGLDIAFACDWDVPSDSIFDNTVITDPVRQMIALQGQYSAARQQGFAGLAAYRSDAVPITGGFAWGNQQQVYALGGYSVDSVWKYMQATTNYNSTWNDSIGDMSIVMVIAKNYTVTASSRLAFNVVLAAKRAETNLGGLGALNTAVDQARSFITATVCNACGDANSDGAVDISDVVFLISHIFSGGSAPAKCGYNKGKGDANGDGTLDISDAVYLIARIFSGGQPPKCQGM